MFSPFTSLCGFASRLGQVMLAGAALTSLSVSCFFIQQVFIGDLLGASHIGFKNVTVL
jgi:hypothetical protein